MGIYLTLLICFILGPIVSLTIHELLHYYIYKIQGVGVVIFSCIFFHVSNKKIVLKYLGLMGANFIDVKSALTKYGYEKTVKKIRANLVMTNMMTIILGIAFFMLALSLNNLYLSIIMLFLAILLVSIFIGSFRKVGDFSTFKNLKKSEETMLRYKIMNELLFGLTSETYQEVDLFFEKNFKNLDKSVYVLLVYMLNYGIIYSIELEEYVICLIERLFSDNEAINVRLLEYRFSVKSDDFLAEKIVQYRKSNGKIRLLPDDSLERIFQTFNAYKEITNELKEKIYNGGIH